MPRGTLAPHVPNSTQAHANKQRSLRRPDDRKTRVPHESWRVEDSPSRQDELLDVDTARMRSCQSGAVGVKHVSARDSRGQRGDGCGESVYRARTTRVPVMCNILVKSYNRQASVTFERLMGYQQNLRQSIGGQAPVPNPMSSQVSHL